MPRLLVHVEGETEETFVNEVLKAHLIASGYDDVSARIVGNARLRMRRGGIRPWPAVRGDIVKHLKEDRACLATTMMDFYKLPSSGAGEWPGRRRAASASFPARADFVENALSADIYSVMGGSFDPARFVPFVTMHEFEGLLFSDCYTFASAVGRRSLAKDLQSIRDEFTTPEEINDREQFAPSKRVQNLMPEYQKPLHGVLAVIDIGLSKIRVSCPHFGGWLSKLETLV